MSTRTRRNLRNRSVIILDSDDSCIDLTEEDSGIVDLTSSQNTVNNEANDSPIVVIDSTSESNSRNRRRRNRFADIEDIDDDDDNNENELPPNPFNIPTPIRPSRFLDNSAIQSPEPIKITCPVCLDDDKAIKKGKKKLASTQCGHVFCTECIYDCVRTQHCCPVCRKRLTNKQVHLLHI